MIYLITGQPGHGKTLRAIELGVKYVEQGREVYASGIRGLDHKAAGFHVLEDPTKWQELPDGAVILLDECYTAYPTRSGASKVPPHVEAMATHRHRGFDFILIAQQAQKQIDGFLLGLVERHEHVRRKFGFKKSIILWWDRFSPNVTTSDTKKLWSFPEKIMKRNLYESTVQDTTERKVPWFYFAIPILLIIIAIMVNRINAFFTDPIEAAKAASAQTEGVKPLGASLGARAGSSRPDDIAGWMRPRLEGQPWTAKAFDSLSISAMPEIYCIAVEDGGCSCITEQGTKYVVKPLICRAIARDGVYNPTRAPVRERERSRPRESASSVSSAPAPVAGIGGWPSGVGAAVYTPPASPGSWSAER